ncbi:MAG TPA: GNAT family N-acetyltransferase [Mycobacteriales bacterium]|nr:GNAT family N-acetyltransferase [Mycobacteriales bacterium]
MPAETLDLRRVTTADWRAVRHLRLAALADLPMAYCERWSDAAALDDEAWRSRAARGAEGGDSFQVMAFDGARPVATATSYVDDAGAHLVSVHVAPDRRGAGLLERLVDAVVGWASGQGAEVLLLEVHEQNHRARAAYRRLGFTETGSRRPYPLDPAADELEMALRLPAA